VRRVSPAVSAPRRVTARNQLNATAARSSEPPFSFVRLARESPSGGRSPLRGVVAKRCRSIGRDVRCCPREEVPVGRPRPAARARVIPPTTARSAKNCLAPSGGVGRVPLTFLQQRGTPLPFGRTTESLRPTLAADTSVGGTTRSHAAARPTLRSVLRSGLFFSSSVVLFCARSASSARASSARAQRAPRAERRAAGGRASCGHEGAGASEGVVTTLGGPAIAGRESRAGSSE
jgi:hypothetical protein